MSTTELQNILIRKILNIENLFTLEQINSILVGLNEEKIVQLSEIDQSFVLKGMDQIEKGDFLTNDEVFDKAEKWLSE